MKRYLKLILASLGVIELILLYFWLISLIFYVFSDIEGAFLIQKAIYFIWLAPCALFFKDNKVSEIIMSWGDKIFSQ